MSTHRLRGRRSSPNSRSAVRQRSAPPPGSALRSHRGANATGLEVNQQAALARDEQVFAMGIAMERAPAALHGLYLRCEPGILARTWECAAV